MPRAEASHVSELSSHAVCDRVDSREGPHDRCQTRRLLIQLRPEFSTQRGERWDTGCQVERGRPQVASWTCSVSEFIFAVSVWICSVRSVFFLSKSV